VIAQGVLNVDVRPSHESVCDGPAARLLADREETLRHHSQGSLIAHPSRPTPLHVRASAMSAAERAAGQLPALWAP
jgi:hypothetical protein